jgi:hypothetical protein
MSPEQPKLPDEQQLVEGAVPPAPGVDSTFPLSEDGFQPADPPADEGQQEDEEQDVAMQESSEDDGTESPEWVTKEAENAKTTPPADTESEGEEEEEGAKEDDDDASVATQQQNNATRGEEKQITLVSEIPRQQTGREDDPGNGKEVCCGFGDGHQRRGRHVGATSTLQRQPGCASAPQDSRGGLRRLGVPVREKSHMFGNNKSVVGSAAAPHAKLHKCHNALSFH